MTGVLIRGKSGHRTQRERPCDDRADTGMMHLQAWDTDACQPPPGAGADTRDGHPPEPTEGAQPCPPLHV